jgi:NAD(P)-dependent dehydrogenase (short-subunit alcohol dehydrogenase family)
VSAFTRSLALQVSEHGIRVNDIAPDVTETPQLPYGAWLDDTEYARADRWVPLGRFGTPADHAGVALFLASDLSGFVTGATIPVDGGTLVAGGWYRTAKDGRTWTNRPFDA